jgi:hypothetical protein
MALSPKREIKPAPDGFRNAILIYPAYLDDPVAKDPETGAPLPVRHPAGASLVVPEPIAELWAERGIATVL